jgi:hypothetical protein
MKNPLAPKRITWITGLIDGILGITVHFTPALILGEHNFTLFRIGFIVLAVGTMCRLFPQIISANSL